VAVVDAVRDHDGSVADASAYLAQPESKVRAAVRYYAEFRDEVDSWAQRMRDESRREAEAFTAEASLT
jgi:hypothetical protein